ncbi:hypothetical protein KIPB_003843 [Kipferlia bialata]|uniref:Uncharacterized protein n=1 Tax=Kipferlia bialata TaxID=797122 RepID=A0A9K3CSX9_9EUKA|nr:hypothetical protein KIPB_003843 [Kipferlia bialata]|eukprot:g3843.t1
MAKKNTGRRDRSGRRPAKAAEAPKKKEKRQPKIMRSLGPDYVMRESAHGMGMFATRDLTANKGILLEKALFTFPTPHDEHPAIIEDSVSSLNKEKTATLMGLYCPEGKADRTEEQRRLDIVGTNSYACSRV